MSVGGKILAATGVVLATSLLCATGVYLIACAASASLVTTGSLVMATTIGSLISGGSKIDEKINSGEIYNMTTSDLLQNICLETVSGAAFGLVSALTQIFATGGIVVSLLVDILLATLEDYLGGLIDGETVQKSWDLGTESGVACFVEATLGWIFGKMGGAGLKAFIDNLIELDEIPGLSEWLSLYQDQIIEYYYGKEIYFWGFNYAS